jgi:hypothetical protein
MRQDTGMFIVAEQNCHSACLAELYCSALSSFQMGWQELNVGTWMMRLQPREYTIRATGWVRTVSGIQSLNSRRNRNDD